MNAHIANERIINLLRKRECHVLALRDGLSGRRHWRERGHGRGSSNPCVHDARIEMLLIRRIDAKLARLAKIPAPIRASILEMCQVIDKGSTSALFGRVHDVRKWIGER